jgi:hypothetical protein
MAADFLDNYFVDQSSFLSKKRTELPVAPSGHDTVNAFLKCVTGNRLEGFYVHFITGREWCDDSRNNAMDVLGLEHYTILLVIYK